MENAFHPDLNTHIDYYSWKIASKGWKIGWKIFRFPAYLPAFIMLIMCSLRHFWEIWWIFSTTL